MCERLEFDGERVVPDLVDPNLMAEHLARYRFARQFIHDAVVLDLACGTGYGSRVLSDKAARIYALDLSEKAVRYAKEKYEQSSILFLAGDGVHLPFLDAQFDVVVAFEIFEHVTEVHGFLQEIKRVLNSGGVLLLSTPNRLVSEEDGMASNPYHIREYSPEEFLDFLHSVFPHVILGSQSHSEGISITFPNQHSFGRLECSADREWTPQLLAQSQFLIAMCSSISLNKEVKNPYFYADIHENILQTRNRHLKIFKAQELELRSRIANLDHDLQIKQGHIQKLEIDLGKAIQAHTLLQSEFEKKEGHISIYQQELQCSKENFDQLQEDWQKQKNHILLFEEKLAGCRQRINQLEGEVTHLEELLRDYHKILNRLNRSSILRLLKRSPWLGNYLKRTIPH